MRLFAGVLRDSPFGHREHGNITWSEGDLFVVPVTEGALQDIVRSGGDTNAGAAIYRVHDQRLDYTGASRA